MGALTGLILTIGSLLFVILLCIVYFSKQRFLSIKNKIYRYMIVTEIILLVTEIISSLSGSLNNNLYLNLVLYRIHWFTGILWITLLFYYSLIFLKNYQSENLFELFSLNKKMKISLKISIITMIIFFIFPFENIDAYNINYIPGLAAYYTIFYCIGWMLAILIITIKEKDTTTNNKKYAIIIMIIELVFTLLCQFAFPKISIYGIAFALQLYFLYFIIENPDLKIITKLEDIKKEIEKSSKAKVDFLSNMSHEIRSPMNAIMGFSEELLNEQNFNEKVAIEDIKNIATAGNNLLDIINNILDISKIESGNDTLEYKEYSINKIFRELSNIINVRIGNRPIKFIIDIDSDVPDILKGDSTKIFQVLLNVLTNSVKYTEVGKIKLSVSCENSKKISLLHFKISDTGYGIKKEDYNKLFSKFSRLDSATDNEIEGTGLGLVITKKYVDLMRGKIWFESEYEVGTNFYIDIPQEIISLNKEEDKVDNISEYKNLEFFDCSNKKILIVDDNNLNIKVASRLLSSYKFDIDTSTSGEDAIYKIKNENKYDMIFMDHMMPGLDGIETMHKIRKLDDFDIPPIIALTANAISGMREMYLKEGFDDYLSKPINMNKLNEIIEKFIKKESDNNEKDV